METTPIVPLPGFDRLAGLDAAGLAVVFLALLAFDFALVGALVGAFGLAFAFALAFGFDFALAM